MRKHGRWMKNIAGLLLLLALLSLLLPFCKFNAGDGNMTLSGIEVIKTGGKAGYTYFKDVMAGMYYGSYSLPTYVTIWSGDAFIKTTIIPFIMMVLINYGILMKSLKLSPLKFMKRDIKKHSSYIV